MRRVDWLAVAAILLVAASLRIIGISYGGLNPDFFPSYAPHGMTHEQLPIQPDEFFSVSIPVSMALRGNLNPEFFEYPSFIVNANYALYRLTGALDRYSPDERQGKTLRAYAEHRLYVFSRMISVFGGLLQVACAYAIGRLVAGRYAAFCGGALVAVAYTLVQHAHYIKPGTLATGWMMLAAWACFAALHARALRQRHIMLILAALATGLAATTRYNSLAVAPMLLLSGCILLYRHPSRVTLQAVVGCWLLVPLVFFLCSPYILRDFEHFWRDFSRIVGQFITSGINVAEYFLVDHNTGLAYLLVYMALFALGIPACIGALLGLWSAWQARPAGNLFSRDSLCLDALLIATVVLPYSILALRTIRPGHSDNLLMLMLPFVALLAAIGCDWLARRVKLPPSLSMPILAIILVIQPLFLSLQVVRMFSQPDTRQTMLAWIHERIPPGSRFLLNGAYNVPLDEAIYPNHQHSPHYAAELPSAADYDYMIYSDAIAFDILRSHSIVPAEVIAQERDYLDRLDQAYARLTEVSRPQWTGAEAMMNTASFWHNPGLIVYCVKPALCEA